MVTVSAQHCLFCVNKHYKALLNHWLIYYFFYIQELPTIYLPEPHGDDDAPYTPRDSEVDSISDDIDIMLGDNKSDGDGKDKNKQADPAAKFKSFDFPVYPLSQTRGKHEPCGYIPITFYYAKKYKPRTFVRQSGIYFDQLRNQMTLTQFFLHSFIRYSLYSIYCIFLKEIIHILSKMRLFIKFIISEIILID